MADAAMADATPLLPGLPDDVVIWEILVRLPPKYLLRSRAVSPAWRRATSTQDFLQCHHAHQPTLPLFYNHSELTDGGVSLDILAPDHRAAGAADRFQTVARLKTAPPEEALARDRDCDTPRFYLRASRDGLLLLTTDCYHHVSICNPATRQYAPLHQLHGFCPHGMYPTAGEYRLLLSRFDDGDQLAMYDFTIGSAQPPRRIPFPMGCPEPPECPGAGGFLFKGSLYWHTGSEILVFDTTNESFRHIRSPYFPACTAQLFETGGMLGILVYDDQKTAMYIFAMQNQQSEKWNFKSIVRLPVAETRQHCQCPGHRESVMVVPGDGGLLILLKCGAWLFQVDGDGDGDGGVIVHGKLIASFRYSDIIMSSRYLLKQTLVQHTFFPTLEGYVANALPFI